MLDSIIRAATLKDIPQLLTLINSAYRGEEAKGGWTHEADLIEGAVRADEGYLSELLQDANASILTYVIEEKIIGCVYLQVQSEKVYLGMLSVAPSAQAGGVGKALLGASEDWATEKKKTSIIMNVISLRDSLIQWYERNGYKDTTIRKPFPDETRFGVPRQPVEFMIMEKRLVRIN